MANDDLSAHCESASLFKGRGEHGTRAEGGALMSAKHGFAAGAVSAVAVFTPHVAHAPAAASTGLLALLGFLVAHARRER
jgi:hypothetical protein